MQHFHHTTLDGKFMITFFGAHSDFAGIQLGYNGHVIIQYFERPFGTGKFNTGDFAAEQYFIWSENV